MTCTTHHAGCECREAAHAEALREWQRDMADVRAMLERSRHDAAQAVDDVERLTRERDAAQAHRAIAVRERDIALRDRDALVARLIDALEARDAAVRSYLAAEARVSYELADDSDAGDAAALLARMHAVRTRRDEALARLRALVPP